MTVLIITYAACYRPEWNLRPQAYIENGLVAPGKSRRLGKTVDAAVGFKGYVGVFSPAVVDEKQGADTSARFFASLFLFGRTFALHTHPTFDQALADLQEFHTRLQRRSW